MTSVKAMMALFVSATVTWVSSEACVAATMALVTLPWPAAACASSDAAFAWVCWTWFKALVI